MLVKRASTTLLKESISLPIIITYITQQQQVHRNIFTYYDRGGFSLSFGHIYVKFEPRPQKLLAVQDKNLGLSRFPSTWLSDAPPHYFLKVVPTYFYRELHSTTTASP